MTGTPEVPARYVRESVKDSEKILLQSTFNCPSLIFRGEHSSDSNRSFRGWEGQVSQVDTWCQRVDANLLLALLEELGAVNLHGHALVDVLDVIDVVPFLREEVFEVLGGWFLPGFGHRDCRLRFSPYITVPKVGVKIAAAACFGSNPVALFSLYLSLKAPSSCSRNRP